MLPREAAKHPNIYTVPAGRSHPRRSRSKGIAQGRVVHAPSTELFRIFQRIREGRGVQCRPFEVSMRAKMPGSASLETWA